MAWTLAPGAAVAVAGLLVLAAALAVVAAMPLFGVHRRPPLRLWRGAFIWAAAVVVISAAGWAIALAAAAERV